jgi:hypothetical protein
MAAMLDQNDDPPNVRELAEAFSVQARYSNKVWLALIAAATLVLYPNGESNNAVKLPFSLGSVDEGTYKVIGFLILIILMISYCQAYAGAHIATRFAHERLERINPESKRLEARKLFDLLVVGTFLRVSYLVQFPTMPRLSAIYYCVLKFVANAVTFGIPITALITVYVQLAGNPSVSKWIYYGLFFALCITSITVLQALILELRHIFRLAKLYWKGELALPRKVHADQKKA